MSHIKNIFAASWPVVLMLLIITGCIKNDIPYPYIKANFLTLTADGQTSGTVIDSINNTATIPLDEDTDIYNVIISGYTITPGATLVEDIFSSPVDLSSPINVTLRMYQDYTWTIRATQTIERYFEVENQVGEAVIDVPGRRIVISVTQSADLSKIKVIRAKLANTGSVITPDIAEGGVIDARHPVELRVEVFSHSQIWTLYVEQTDEKVTTGTVDAWTCVAWVNGVAEAGRDNGIEYRLEGDEDWIKVPASNITSNGGAFTGRIDHLQPQTTYQARAYSDEYTGQTVNFTTGANVQLPNSNFDEWWLDGKVWCPWAEGSESYWDTGNKGATTLGSSNTQPTDDTPTGTGKAAKLETKFVGLGSLGKLAAGNLFAGTYVRTVGTNGVLAFGRPFTERPTKLKGMFKYTTAPISHASNDFKQLIGEPDTCIIWVALIDSNSPFEIRTEPANRHLFDPDGSEVVAYGKFEQSETVGEYIPFEFEIQYKSTSRIPKYLLVTCSASKYGDYFTGGEGATLYLDDFVLEYDY